MFNVTISKWIEMWSKRKKKYGEFPLQTIALWRRRGRPGKFSASRTWSTRLQIDWAFQFHFTTGGRSYGEVVCNLLSPTSRHCHHLCHNFLHQVIVLEFIICTSNFTTFLSGEHYLSFFQERFAHTHLCSGCHIQLYGKLCSQAGTSKVWSHPLELGIDLCSIWQNRGRWREKSNLRSLGCQAATGIWSTDTRDNFKREFLSQFMWFVSTYMALFTVFRLHHKVCYMVQCRMCIHQRTDGSSLVFIQPACLEVLWKLAWVSF